MRHRPSQRARSVPTTQRATRAHTHGHTARHRENDGSQLIIIGACLLGVGLVTAIAVAFAATNDTHPLVRILPWLPVAVGFCLLVYALSRVGVRRKAKSERAAPSEALESNVGLPEGSA